MQGAGSSYRLDDRPRPIPGRVAGEASQDSKRASTIAVDRERARGIRVRLGEFWLELTQRAAYSLGASACSGRISKRRRYSASASSNFLFDLGAPTLCNADRL